MANAFAIGGEGQAGGVAVGLLPGPSSRVQNRGTRKRRVTTASTRKFTSRAPILQLVRSSASVHAPAGPIICATIGAAQSGPRSTCWKNRCNRRYVEAIRTPLPAPVAM